MLKAITNQKVKQPVMGRLRFLEHYAFKDT